MVLSPKAEHLERFLGKIIFLKLQVRRETFPFLLAAENRGSPCGLSNKTTKNIFKHGIALNSKGVI